MPSPYPKYEDGVPKDCCRVRSCNAEGQEFVGQIAKFPYAHPTDKTKGIVKRKPVFGHDSDYTLSLLEPVFSTLGGNCDYERLSEQTLKVFVDALDKVDMEAVAVDACEEWVSGMLNICNVITGECTGLDFDDLGIGKEVVNELGRAWKHFVRLIWMRDLEWEDVVRCLSDPNGEYSVDAEYYLQDPSQMVRYVVSSRLMVPLQVWSVLVKLGYDTVGKEVKAYV